MKNFIRIGTRGSKLALVQANLVKNLLIKAHDLKEENFEIVIIKTTGDKIQDRKLAEIGGKGLFTKEIEEELLLGNIDLAVHSMKDMPAILPDGLFLSAFLEREDPRDAFVSLKYKSLDALPDNAKIGTSSIRRAIQLKKYNPNFEIIDIRGNVDTRIAKIEDNYADATILAAAGLNRINFSKDRFTIIDSKIMLSAVCQGIICIETKIDNDFINNKLKSINHFNTEIAGKAERAFLITLGASCTTPIGALATVEGERISMEAMMATLDGQKIFREKKESHINQATELGCKLANILQEKIN